MIIAHMVKMLHRDPARASFTKYDPRGTGSIGEGDLKGVLKSWNMVLTPVQVKWVYTLFDPEKSGNLNYRAFADRILDDRDTSKLGGESGTSEEGNDALKRRIAQNFKNVGEAFRHYDRYVRMIRFRCLHWTCFLILNVQLST
jgi:hypothetical protein